MLPFRFLLALLLPITSLFAQKDSSFLVFAHANVIDGVSPKPLRNVTVRTAHGKIVAIDQQTGKLPPQAVVIDLKGQWLLPGFIDAHVHFFSFDAARRALALGVTTARTMQCDHFVDVQIREAHRQGQRDLPDVIAAGYQMRPDMAAAFFEDFPELTDLSPRLGGIENVRRVVRALISRGVDHLKILATERAGTPDTDPRKRTFTDAEIRAIVAEAQQAGRFVAAHAHGDEGAYAAVEAGVRSLEHGTYVSERTLDLMQQRNTYFVPTFTVPKESSAQPETANNPVLAERRRTIAPLREKVTRQAYERGIALVAGTDIRYATSDYSLADEGISMQQASGMSLMETLQAMTVVPARCLGIESRTGSLQAGLEADLVVLGHNPLESLEALRDLRMVINDGQVALNQP